MNLIDYVTDPILRAPTIGCVLMGVCTSLVGVISFLRRRALLGETLSRAAYPGVSMALLLAAMLYGKDLEESMLTLFTLAGAAISALLGHKCIDFLELRLKVKSDAALCFVLSAFFGIGVTISSRIQMTHSYFYNQIHLFLYGQPATMTDFHLTIYICLTLLTLSIIFIFYKEIKTISFDRIFAKSIGMQVALIEGIILLLIVLAIVIGIRSVGIVLMSAMLIAPAIAARQYTDQLHKMFWLAALFGGGSGFFGNYLSVEISSAYAVADRAQNFSVPTGPLIALTASALCFFALLFAPSRGLVLRRLRIFAFHWRVMEENILKSFWRLREQQNSSVSFQQIASIYGTRPWLMRILLWNLRTEGWIDFSKTEGGHYLLTEDGDVRARHITRLHRLWEVYLVEYLGVGAERVHKSAEEMEHIITPEIEQQLDQLLKQPQYDPHNSPIPAQKGMLKS